MEQLKDGTILYHGSYCKVEKIDLTKCHHGKDFGRGFYLTTSQEQATKFVKISIKNAINIGTLDKGRQFGFVNMYKLRMNRDIREFDFQEADADWLHFVSGNRDQKLFREGIEALTEYNAIGGKIANDRTAATLSQYISGAFGVPGEADADEIAMKLLLPNRLENQYCFRDDKAIGCLQYLNAEEIVI